MTQTYDLTDEEREAMEVDEQIERESITPTVLLPLDQRTVYQRMVAIIDELPAIGKTQRNEQQKFMFRGHDDVMNALNPLLARHGVFVVPDVIERVTGERSTRSNATMYEVNLHVRFTFYGAGGDSFTASGWGEGTDMGDKATSKAMTMALKYVIAQTFALATEETSYADADAGTAQETTRGVREPRAARPTAAETGVKVPRSWSQLEAALTAYDTLTWPAFKEFCEDMSQHLYGVDVQRLTRENRDIVWQKAVGAYIVLAEKHSPGELPPIVRKDMQAAFASRLDGHVLEGPPWSMSPDEAETRPHFEAQDAPGDDVPASEGEDSESVE